MKPVEFVVHVGTGGGAVSVQLMGNHDNSTLSNPIEAGSHQRAGTLRALCEGNQQPMPHQSKRMATQSWTNTAICTSAGIPVDQLMLRSIFLPSGVTPDQTENGPELFKKTPALPNWKEFMDTGGFSRNARSGDAFVARLGKSEQMHRFADDSEIVFSRICEV